MAYVTQESGVEKIVIVYTVRHTVIMLLTSSIERGAWWDDPLGVTI